MEVKRGRPTKNPKQSKISVRIDAECEAILNQYCQETGKDRADAVRDGMCWAEAMLLLGCGYYCCWSESAAAPFPIFFRHETKGKA